MQPPRAPPSRACRSDLSRRRPAAASQSSITHLYHTHNPVGYPAHLTLPPVRCASQPLHELLAPRQRPGRFEWCVGPAIVSRRGKGRALRHTKRRGLLLASVDIARTAPRPTSSAQLHRRHAGPLPAHKRARRRVLPALIQEVGEQA